MINRRHFLTTVAVGTASAAALAACGSGSGSSGQTGSADSPVTINYTWWGNDDRAERTRKAIALFESKNPDIKVNGNFTDFATTGRSAPPRQPAAACRTLCSGISPTCAITASATSSWT